MLKAVLLDFDGVLAKEEIFSERLAREYGITTDTTGSFFRTDFQKCLVGNADLKQELRKHLTEWGWRKSVDELLQFWFECDRDINEILISYIQKLRQIGILCYIVTNQEKYRTEYILYQLNLIEKFDGIFSSSHVGYLKDDPNFFKYALRELPNLKAHEILFIDDDVEKIVAAKQVGLFAAIYTDFLEIKRLLNSSITESVK